MEIKKIAVVGAGVMGSGIAQVFAANGFSVLLLDIREEFCLKAIESIEKKLAKIISKGKLTESESGQIIGRIETSISLDDCKDAQLLVEATPENLKTKKDVLFLLDKICPPEVIFATNTSSLSITNLAAATSRPDKVIGMHFMNPVPVMELVEVVNGFLTSNETRDTIFNLSKKLKKTPVEVKDFPGFVSNRILMPMINEAIFCLTEGIADKESIDSVMKLGMSHPVGPLELADLIGLDVCLSILEILHSGIGDPKYRPAPLLRNMVAAGKLGRKSGQGFYIYKNQK